MNAPDARDEVPRDPEVTEAFQPDELASELVRVLDGYMAELQAGARPDREKLLREHPSLAGQLEQCLASIEFIHGAARPNAGTPAQLGDFRIVREIGRGGMGVVYEAEQVSLKRKVALKVLRFGGATDPEAMRRFQDEALTIARLHHTNIVPIFAVGCEQGVHYYAMQFIDGRGLDAVLQQARQRGESLAAADVARWGLQAAEALVHAHQRSVIHRDIKPSNLLLDSDGTLWLTDFGLAKRQDEITQTVAGVLMGTPRYMSPEQAATVQQPVDHRTDIYSLGATLYELATGQPMFDADTPHGVITQILTAEPPPPRQVRADLPRDLETIILKCLAKEPAQRYATAQALADDLRAHAEGRAIKARRTSLAERAVRWVRKQRRSVALAAATAAIAVLVVVGAILGWQWHREAQMGQVRLSTDGPSLVADVLDAAGEPVVPGFPVPTPEPVTLPAGSYQLRLSAPEVLSETWPLEVPRRGPSGGPTSQSVRLDGRWLWPPTDSRLLYSPEVMDVAGRADLILTQLDGQPQCVSVRRLDGATGKPVWANDLVFDEQNLPAGGDKGEWVSLLSNQYMRSPTLLQPPPDLDGDGTCDLVWAARMSPSLLAVSGKHGKVLWWFRARPDAREAVDTSRLRPLGFQYPYHGSTLGRPVAADVDGDGTPDLMACFVSPGETFADEKDRQIAAESQEWVEAVSGRTGKSLWRCRMDKRWLDGKYSNSQMVSSSSAESDLNCLLRVVQTKEQPLVAMVAGRTLVGLDLTTGKEAWPPEDLGLDPIGLPQWADVDGDGRPELLLLRPKPPVPGPGKGYYGRHVTELLLAAVSLSTRRPLWEAALRPALRDLSELRRSTSGPAAVHWVADLEQDGKPEVIIPVGRHDGFWLWDAATNSLHGSGGAICQSCWSGVEVIDGATGNRRWRCPLWDTGGDDPPVIHSVMAGPDLDGDGSRDLFVAAVGYDPGFDKQSLTVVAVSAAEGRVLWRWRQAGGHDLRTLRWWQAGLDGWPQLVVPAESGPGGQPVTYVLSAATGRLTHVLSEACVHEVADFNGDGIADLSCWKFFSTATQSRAKLAVIPGALPEPWRRFGSWTAAQDFDRDGCADLIAVDGSSLAARSGRDGRRLWPTQKIGRLSDWSLGQACFSAPVPEGDVDGDGHPDLLRFDDAQTVDPDARSSSSYSTVSALSGKDGRRLWTAPDFGMQSGGSSSGDGGRLKHSYPILDGCDLDGDGQAEVVVAYFPRDKVQETHLAVLSGRDGTVRWKAPFVRGAFTGLHGVPRGTVPQDLNGDGVRDLVLWVPKGDAVCEVRAFSGRDGSALWPAASAVVGTADGSIWPPVVGDLDGDGIPEVVVTRRDSEAGASEGGWEVLALGGRDGRHKWTWRWRDSFSSYLPLPPLLVDFHGDGRRSVCLGLYDNDAPQIVVLDADGRVGNRIPLDLAWLVVHPRLRYVWPWWTYGDLNGDGKESLLFASGGHLCASRGSPQEILWKWPIPVPGDGTGDIGNAGEILQVQPAAKDGAATVVVWVGTSVYGLAGPTGLPRWRCDVPLAHTMHGSSGDPTVQLLATDDLVRLPRILCRRQQTGLDFLSTVVRQAWPAGPDGRYQAPAPAPMTYEPEPVLAVPGQPLPWTPGALGSGRTRPMPAWTVVFYGLVYSGVYALIIAVFPGRLVYRTIRQRSWGARLPLTAYAAVAFVPYVYVAMHYLSHSGAIMATLASLPDAAFFVALVSWSVRRQWTRVGLLVAFSVVAGAALAAVLLWADPRSMDTANEYSWKGWYLAWLLGAYGTGALLVLAYVVRAAARGVRRLVRRKALTMAEFDSAK